MNYKNTSDIPKAYDPSTVEDKWYRYWEDNKIYHSVVEESKEPYTIVIPPPNVTGMLHLGHILNNTIQDIYIRYKRMQGYNACWVPGTDHASIATESKVIQFLNEKGIDKFSLGRDEFLKHCWEWTEKYGGIIIRQLRKLGVSCDWERQRFTMDDHYYKKVAEAFVYLYKKGLIYRGYRMVNWCPASKSAISDEEVEYKTVKGKLWHIRYPILDSEEYLVVATTRPETMLGDTGVAVHPDDKRYKQLIGKKVVLPLVGREIPIFTDEYVDTEFGTGAVKVTPAHDLNDYDMGKRHELEVINIFNDNATTNENVPNEFQNLDRYVVRDKVIERLKELDLIERIEDYTNNIGYSQRGGVPIEPYLSEQWFLKMEDISKPALSVVQEEKIRFHPSHWVKTYEHWMLNIKDWCISRQLWWGHRIPVWYNKIDGKIYCEIEPPSDIENWEQDKDVLDTWASSWLWAHEVFQTPEEQAYYYPTDLLVTAPDIIFFWVARMIIAGIEFKGEIPFKDVYFTSILRDGQGRKMSKSLGNSPDPLDVIKDYGADALRFTVTYIAPLGQDVLFSTDKCEIGRNFANKIWNAARFLIMNRNEISLDDELTDSHLDFTDNWIYSRFQSTLQQYYQALNKFDINGAAKIVYAYVWNDFCDWYIELAKKRLYSDDKEIKSALLSRATKLFEQMLTIVHPFMPFITEEIWQLLYPRREAESISTALMPALEESMINKAAEFEMEFVQSVVNAIRNIRGEMSIPPSKQVSIFLKTNSITEQQIQYIKLLGKVDEITIDPDIKKLKSSASAVVKGCDIFIPLEGLIDIDVEKKRLEKEINRIEGLLLGVDKKLSNKNFVDKAPAEIIEKERSKERDWKTTLGKLRFLKSELE